MDLALGVVPLGEPEGRGGQQRGPLAGPDPVQGHGAELGRLADGGAPLEAPRDPEQDDPGRSPVGDERRGAGGCGHGAEADELDPRPPSCSEQVRRDAFEDGPLELRGDAEEGPGGIRRVTGHGKNLRRRGPGLHPGEAESWVLRILAPP